MLSKEKSKYNGLVEATGVGFRPNEAVTLMWPDGTVLATGIAGGDGRVGVTFRTPLVALGTYRVRASDAFGHAASTPLAVIPRILLNEESGPITTRLRVYFYGFAPGERVEVRWYASDEASYTVVVTVEIAANGRGSSLVAIPRRSPDGPHKVMGRVVGVSRSASATFTVTSGVAGAEADDHLEPKPTPTVMPTSTPSASPEPTVALEPTSTPIPAPTGTPVDPVEVVTPAPTATATTDHEPTAAPSPAATPDSSPAPTLEPSPTATATPTAVADPVATPEREETPTP